MASSTRGTGMVAISAFVTEAIEAVTSRRVDEPYPVTTIWSSVTAVARSKSGATD
jgi:hypothetical protein